ncbi:hypothetical protein LPW11_16670 [Geomonas sp. RF6]|uniref:hypothetical protein n=1 Tax=Geomonas sp. RF6 TaxID=2897342 RepID=UPI001E35A960|nr:hypothetical protein [Geomonas sp. RF6]UFS69521.1 hypothetical protein LPW11_16670 [Geomonas sp. RF6]
MRVNVGKIARPVLAMAFILCCGEGKYAEAGVSVNMNLNIGPPPVIVSAPPEVVFMPNYGTYFVPGLSFDIFFYNGYWWSPRGDNWYRAPGYNGPWRVIEHRYVPGPVRHVPHDYRRVYARERHIPYGQWKKEHGRHGGGESGRGGGGKHGEGSGHGGGRGNGGGHGGGDDRGHGGGHGRH